MADVQKTPLGTKILAVLMGLKGVGGILGIFGLSFVGFSSALSVLGLGGTSGTILLIIGAVLSLFYLVGAVLVFKKHTYGWWALVVWSIESAIKPITYLFHGSIFVFVGLIGIAFWAFILWYLFKNTTRTAFIK